MDIMQDEQKLLLDHDADGIKELDNDLPPWWENLFLITVVFSVVYYFGYEVYGWFYSPEQEYKAEVAHYEEKAKAQTVARVLMTDEGSLANGKETFSQNCAVCHGSLGEGGIGPNLTDKHWLHGGSFDNIVTVITKGVPAKGMVAWKGMLGQKKIIEVASYVVSLKGTNPPNAKEPQGEVYNGPDKN